MQFSHSAAHNPTGQTHGTAMVSPKCLKKHSLPGVTPENDQSYNRIRAARCVSWAQFAAHGRAPFPAGPKCILRPRSPARISSPAI